MNKNRRNTPFHVGDRVSIGFGRRKLTGVVTEALGAIGVQGRHVYQVNIPMDPFDPMMVELPEDEMEAAGAESVPDPAVDNAKIIEYLVNGGLITMLRANIAGGKNQPRTWICFDNLGNITHTFDPQRGGIGGQVIPFFALQGDKVFTPKRDCVTSFVRSFGLTEQDADSVISNVGTMP